MYYSGVATFVVHAWLAIEQWKNSSILLIFNCACVHFVLNSELILYV